MKQLDILGIHLTDYNLREGIRIVNHYLKSGALNTIGYLSNQVLIGAGDSQDQKEWIENMDMTVFGNTDILNAAGIDNRSRIHEIENDEFFREFMKRLNREHKTIFLISNDPEKLEKLRAKVEQDRENLSIVGTYLTETADGVQDSMINEINDVAPEVVISCLPFEIQARYMHEYRKMVNANVWLGLLQEQLMDEAANSILETLREKYFKKIFQRRVTKYNQEKPKENE